MPLNLLVMACMDWQGVIYEAQIGFETSLWAHRSAAANDRDGLSMSGDWFPRPAYKKVLLKGCCVRFQPFTVPVELEV